MSGSTDLIALRSTKDEKMSRYWRAVPTKTRPTCHLPHRDRSHRLTPLSWLAGLALLGTLLMGQELYSKDDLQTGSAAPAEANAEAIEQWIKLLGSSDFADREEATRNLWEQGLAAEGALKRATQSSDREIRFRAKAILERFSLGIFVDTDPSKIRLIRRYADADDREKQNLIRSMIAEANIEDIIFLLARESNEEVRNQLHQYVAGALDNLIPRLQNEGKEELIQRALLQFSTTPTSQFLLASYAVGQGPAKSQELLRLAETNWQAEAPDRIARQKVLTLLLSGEIDAAIVELQQFPDPVEGRGWLNSIYLSEQRFSELLTQLTQSQDPEQFQAAPEDWLPQDLVLAVWCARVTDDVRWQRALEPILTEWIKEEKLSHNQRIKLNLLTDRINEGFEEAAETDPLLAFSILCYRDQFKQAFEQFGPGMTPEKRGEWFGQYVEELKKLDEDNNNNRRQITTDENKLRIAIEAAGWLVSLGERSEAERYFDMVFKAIPNRLANARMYQYRIMDLEFRHQLDENFCQHVEQVFNKGRFEQSFAQLNSIDHEKYRFWWWVLESEAPESVDRLKMVRAILHDPANLETSLEQVEQWLQIAEDYVASENPNILQVGSPAVALADTCFANGLNERGIAYLAKAIEAGLATQGQKASPEATQAAQRLAEWYAEREQWENALRVTEQWSKLNLPPAEDGAMKNQAQFVVNSSRKPSRLDWGQVHRLKCLRELNRNEEADAIFENLRSFSYSAAQLSGLARTLDEEGLSQDSTPLWKMLCYQPGKDSRPLSAYSYPAFSGLANIVFRDAEKGQPGWVESFLGYMLADNNDWYLRGSVNSMHPVALLLNFREQVNQSYAYAAFKTNDPAKAVRHLERGLTARPGNVDNVVAFVDQLEASQSEAEKDALFEIARDLHVKVLSDFPGSAMHHNNFAWLCAKAQKNLEEGLSHSLKATELRPYEDTYWDTLAEVYFQMGDLNKALELARLCVQMDPLYPHYQKQLLKYEAAVAESP